MCPTTIVAYDDSLCQVVPACEWADRGNVDAAIADRIQPGLDRFHCDPEPNTRAAHRRLGASCVLIGTLAGGGCQLTHSCDTGEVLPAVKRACILKTA